jgi:hypothetical protein
LVANAQTLPADMQASLETLAANAASGALAARDAEVVVMEGRRSRTGRSRRRRASPCRTRTARSPATGTRTPA